jgi:hypothetical protein
MAMMISRAASSRLLTTARWTRADLQNAAGISGTEASSRFSAVKLSPSIGAPSLLQIGRLRWRIKKLLRSRRFFPMPPGRELSTGVWAPARSA